MSIPLKSSALWLLAMAAPSLASPVAVQSRDLDPNTFRDDMINSHNFFRDQHSAPLVGWNDEAAGYAQDKVNSCLWGHQDPVEGFGENIFAGGFGSWYDVVNGFGHERVLYDWNNPGFSGETGHFTQVVWVNSNSIGCAWNDCGDSGGDPARASGIYVVCKYSPSGNYLGDFPNNVLPLAHGSLEDLASP